MDEQELETKAKKSYDELSCYHGNSARMNINVLLGCIGIGFLLIVLDKGISNSPMLFLAFLIGIAVWMYLERSRYLSLKANYMELSRKLSKKSSEKNHKSQK